MVTLRADVAYASIFLMLSGLAFGIVGNLTGSVSAALIGILLVGIATLPAGVVHYATWRASA